MISFPGVSSLETPRSARSRARAAATGPEQPPQPLGLGGVPGAPRPWAALPCPPSSRGGNPEMEVPGPAGGASFRGRLQVLSTPPAARRPSPHGATSVLTAWGSPRLVSVQTGAGRTCLGVFGSPRGASTPRGRQGQVESEVCVAARVVRGLFAAPLCVCASFCA